MTLSLQVQKGELKKAASPEAREEGGKERGKERGEKRGEKRGEEGREEEEPHLHAGIVAVRVHLITFIHACKTACIAVYTASVSLSIDLGSGHIHTELFLLRRSKTPQFHFWGSKGGVIGGP